MRFLKAKGYQDNGIKKQKVWDSHIVTITSICHKKANRRSGCCYKKVCKKDSSDAFIKELNNV